MDYTSQFNNKSFIERLKLSARIAAADAVRIQGTPFHLLKKAASRREVIAALAATTAIPATTLTRLPELLGKAEQAFEAAATKIIGDEHINAPNTAAVINKSIDWVDAALTPDRLKQVMDFAMPAAQPTPALA